jgi:hypothetical protein
MRIFFFGQFSLEFLEKEYGELSISLRLGINKNTNLLISSMYPKTIFKYSLSLSRFLQIHLSTTKPSQEPPINQKKPKFDETKSHLIDHWGGRSTSWSHLGSRQRGAKKQSLIWQSINVRKASLLWCFTCQSVYPTGQGKLPCFWSAIHLDEYITMILVSISKSTSSYSCN